MKFAGQARGRKNSLLVALVRSRPWQLGLPRLPLLLLVVIAGLSWGALSGTQQVQAAATAKNPPVDLHDVCLNRQVPITSVDEALRLIEELRQDMNPCQALYRPAFYELKPILEVSQQVPLCSEEKFNHIANYHFRYINPKKLKFRFGLEAPRKSIVPRELDEELADFHIQMDEYKQKLSIPIALQQFFKAWCLQVSGLCKRTFVDNMKQAMNMFSDTDYALFQNDARMGSTVNQASELSDEMRAPSSSSEASFDYDLTFKKLVYMPELEGELMEGDIRRHNEPKILDLRTKPVLNRFMHACRTRFQPVYSKLILPIVRLAKLGYDYKGHEIDRIRSKLNGADETVTRWMIRTMICESQGNNLELVEDPANPISMEPLTYSPMYTYTIKGDLWIKGSEALRRELGRISGNQLTGMKKMKFKAGVAARKTLARLDPLQFAWYRRNSAIIGSSLHTMSIITKLVSVGIKTMGG